MEYSESRKRGWLISNARRRAKRDGLPIEFDHTWDLDVPEVCPCCGVNMEWGTMTAPTLDRLIPKLGYTVENVFVICKRCNRRKSDCAPEDMYRIADVCYAEIKRRGLRGSRGKT